MIMEADKSKICRVGFQEGAPEAQMLQFQSKGDLLQNFLLFWGGQSYVLARPSTDYMKHTL